MPKKKPRKLVIQGGVGERAQNRGLPAGWSQEDANKYFSERYEEERRSRVRDRSLDLNQPVRPSYYGHTTSDVDPEEMRRSSRSLLRYNQELSKRSRPADSLERDLVRQHNRKRTRRR